MVCGIGRCTPLSWVGSCHGNDLVVLSLVWGLVLAVPIIRVISDFSSFNDLVAVGVLSLVWGLVLAVPVIHVNSNFSSFND